nr:hypothetical protein [Tanacetum cinerariifolium]
MIVSSSPYNQKEVDELKSKRLAKTQDPLALMANSNNPYVFPEPHQDQSSFNQNYLQQPMPNPEDITAPTTAMNMALAHQTQGTGRLLNRNVGNPAGYNDVIGNHVIQNAVQNPRVQNVGNSNEEYDLMAAAADLNEIKEVNANCILMANLQQASSSGTQTDSEQYTELLEPIPESHQVPQNDNDVISENTSVEQSGETVEQHPANSEETRALYESLYQNLAIEVEKVNSVNRKLKETNTDLTTELARCFEISQEKYDKLERCYQQSIYQEQCLSKKINALHLSTGSGQIVGDFKSLGNEADASLAKHKALELEIEHLLKVVVRIS